MALRIREFTTLQEAQFFLRGGVRGGKPLAGRVYNIVGRTLIFSSPSSVTVTFVAGADSSGLTVREIQDQIVAAIAAVKPGLMDKGLALEEVTPASGVAITGAGTANPLFGFKTGAATVGTVINPPGGAQPALTELRPKATNDGYFAVIDEA